MGKKRTTLNVPEEVYEYWQEKKKDNPNYTLYDAIIDFNAGERGEDEHEEYDIEIDSNSKIHPYEQITAQAIGKVLSKELTKEQKEALQKYDPTTILLLNKIEKLEDEIRKERDEEYRDELISELEHTIKLFSERIKTLEAKIEKAQQRYEDEESGINLKEIIESLGSENIAKFIDAFDRFTKLWEEKNKINSTVMVLNALKGVDDKELEKLERIAKVIGLVGENKEDVV